MEFILRPWAETDLGNLVRYADNPKIAGNMSNKFINPYTEDQGKRFLAYANQASPPRILALEVNGEAVGAIGIHPQEDVYCKNAELGYWLAEPFWGNGIMSQAIQRMVKYGFKNWQLSRIFARPYGSNIGSQRALEKAGFLLEAKLEKTIYKNGKYQDELIFAIRK